MVRHRYSLPPREITVHLAERAGVHKKLDPDARAALSLVNHFGYGAMAATVYSLVEERIPVPAMAKRPLFGAIVWLVSYLGLLPAVGILEPATKHPQSRNLLMIAVHLVWGLVVGVFVETLLAEKQRTAGAFLSARPCDRGTASRFCDPESRLESEHKVRPPCHPHPEPTNLAALKGLQHAIPAAVLRAVIPQQGSSTRLRSFLESPYCRRMPVPFCPVFGNLLRILPFQNLFFRRLKCLILRTPAVFKQSLGMPVSHM
jgi:Protein of unknown function (DUF1440)